MKQILALSLLLVFGTLLGYSLPATSAPQSSKFSLPPTTTYIADEPLLTRRVPLPDSTLPEPIEFLNHSFPYPMYSNNFALSHFPLPDNHTIFLIKHEGATNFTILTVRVRGRFDNVAMITRLAYRIENETGVSGTVYSWYTNGYGYAVDVFVYNIGSSPFLRCEVSEVLVTRELAEQILRIVLSERQG